jgi:hypothetical protein
MANNIAFALLSNKPQTDDVTLCKSSAHFEPCKELSRFRIKGHEYLRQQEIATSKKERQTTSSVWQFGERIVRVLDK